MVNKKVGYIKISDIAETVTKGTTPTTYGFMYEESGVNFIKVESLTSSGKIDKAKVAFISNEANLALKRSILGKGDILFSIAGALGRVSMVEETDLPANTNQALAIIRLKKEDYSNKYIFYALSGPKVKKEIARISTVGAQPNLNLQQVGDLPIPNFAYMEQKKIASILSSIDESIEKTEAIIEQTWEVKKGLMQQLLTRGIGHTKFKKTEIGEIPEDWNLMPLKDCVEALVTGRTYTPEYVDNGVPILRSPDLKRGFPDFTQCLYVTASEHNNFKKAIPKKEDIIYIREGGSLGIPAYNNSEQEFALGQRLSLIRTNKDILESKFLYYQLKSARISNVVRGSIGGNASPHINQKDIEKFIIVLPSLEEQNLIAKSLTSLEDKVSLERVKLTQLYNVKKGLMQSLFTGEIRVEVGEDEVAQA